MHKLKSRRGLSVAEYALMLGIVYLSLTGMNLYLKRGIQARVKDLTTHFIAKDLYAQSPRTHQFVAGNTKSSSEAIFRSQLNQSTRGATAVSSLSEDITRSASESSAPEDWEDMLPE